MYNTFDFIDKLEIIVDSIRESNSFTAIQNGSIWNVTSDNSLSNDDFLEVLGFEYKVQNVTSSGFDIETATFDTEGIWKAKAPYFMYDNALVINKELLEKDNDEVYKYQKYPLVALNMPFDVTQGHRPTANLNLAFLEFTDINNTTEEKRQNVFNTVLIPMYKLFMKKLRERSEFILDSWDFIERIIPLYGSDVIGKHIFDDPLDAIELKNLKLKIKN